MDDQRFRSLYRIVRRLSPPRGKRCQYSDGDILLVLLWAALRHKPVAWACDRRNAPAVMRDRPLPSSSRVSRRLRSVALDTLARRVAAHLRRQLAAAVALGCWIVDAKGLPINRYSKDKQARFGYCNGSKHRGYKLFLIVDHDGVPVAWRVHPMNAAEPTAARELVTHLDRPGYLLGDSAYDSNPLHEQAAAQQLQLIAPRRRRGTGLSHRPHHEARLHAIAMLETHVNAFGRSLYAKRTGIERVFAQLAAGDVRLDHLPSWARTLDRVRRWVNAKLIIAMAIRCEKNLRR